MEFETITEANKHIIQTKALIKESLTLKLDSREKKGRANNQIEDIEREADARLVVLLKKYPKAMENLSELRRGITRAMIHEVSNGDGANEQVKKELKKIVKEDIIDDIIPLLVEVVKIDNNRGGEKEVRFKENNVYELCHEIETRHEKENSVNIEFDDGELEEAIVRKIAELIYKNEPKENIKNQEKFSKDLSKSLEYIGIYRFNLSPTIQWLEKREKFDERIKGLYKKGITVTDFKKVLTAKGIKNLNDTDLTELDVMSLKHEIENNEVR